MSGVVFDPDARLEFLAAVEYYEKCQSGLGLRFRKVVEREIGGIAAMPFRFRVLHPPFRRCLISGFPYAIVFSIEPSFILVLALAHLRKKPGYWLGREERFK